MSPWKMLGFAGTALFAGRWAIQFIASHRSGRSVVPTLFWIVSLLGSLTLVVYFSLSPYRDLVGVLGNAFPASVSLYNLFLIVRKGRPQEAPPPERPRR